MAHAQKPDFVFMRNGRVHLNRQGRQFSPLLAAAVLRISGSNPGYTMFRGSVKSTGYSLHSPISPPLPLPCVTVCHHISTGLYNSRQWDRTSSLWRLHEHTQTTLGRTLQSRDLYLTTHNTHNRQTHPSRRWHSNPQSQQASCRRLTC